ncbi:MAG: hypothetical protein O7E52_04050 [Candidatus Poribacteria bacterium]|nr:hypothetical protein [Candidatus Poribacteria bacterium]
MTEPFRVAAVVTTFFPNSHAGVLIPKFLRGFPTDDGLIPPRTQLASLFIDQIHHNDIGRQIAHQFDIPIYESIRAALTLGGENLAVDAVLLIGEHGDYPRSVLGQEMLPRRYFFEQICGVIAECGRPIPVYNDKHLSYRWDDARWMYTTAKQLNVPLWAGSALPVAWRRPNFEHPLDAPIDQALSIGFHMLERYGFHALESLQCQVERRRGGETGVRSVQCLSGGAVWQAADVGRWSVEVAEHALAAIENGPVGLDTAQVEEPHLFLIEYCDGLNGAALMLGDNGYVRKFAYAQKRGKIIDALEYHTDSGPTHAIFSYMGLNIEDFFLTGVAPNPVERTYLTTGILEAAMISHGSGGKRIQTPHLEIRYTPDKSSPRRPAGPRPAGACLSPWLSLEPEATPAAEPIPVSRDGTVRRRRG